MIAAQRLTEGKPCEFAYVDGLRPGGRHPRLWLVDKDGGLHRFRGERIERVLSVLGTSYEKNGKWSATTYRLAVGSAIAIHLLAPLHGKVWGVTATWTEALAALQEVTGRPVDPEEFRGAVREDFPRTAERFDAADKEPPLE